MNATHQDTKYGNVARVVMVRKNQPARGAIFTVRFGGAQAGIMPPRSHAQATDFAHPKRAGIEGCGPDLFFAEWDFID